MKKKIKTYITIPKKADDLEFNWYGLTVYSSRARAEEDKEESEKILPVEITFTPKKK